jgi:hypothetical protein
MNRKKDSVIQTDTQDILDAIRKIVRALRLASKFSEKQIALSVAQLFVLQSSLKAKNHFPLTSWQKKLSLIRALSQL